MDDVAKKGNKDRSENVYVHAKQFFKQPRFIIPLLIVASLCYGFVITHLSVSTDDLWGDHYFREGALLGQGRYAAPLIDALFHVCRFRPFAVDFLSVICFVFAAVLLCALFKTVTRDKLNQNSYTFFACLFVSYPLIVEIFTYNGANLIVCLGYALTAVALTETWLFLEDKKKYHAACAVACLVVIGGMYESLFPVFLIGSFSILFLQLYSDSAVGGKKIFRESLVFIVILCMAFVLKLITSKIAILITGTVVNAQSINQIGWMNPSPVIVFKLEKMANGLIDHYLRALFYMPVTELVAAILISTVALAALTIKKKNISYVYIYAGSIASLLAMSVLLLSAAGNRMCQAYAYFVAMTFMMLFDWLAWKNKVIAAAALFLAVVIVMWQCEETNKWFYVDDLRYQLEKKVVENIGSELARGYPIQEKPVVFVGIFQLPPVITKETYLSDSELKLLNRIRHLGKRKSLEKAMRVQTVADSYLAWTCWAPVGMYQFFDFNGYPLIQGSASMHEKAELLMADRPGYPRSGYICETNEYIAVKMGNIEAKKPDATL